MTKLLAFLGMSLGGWLGWALGERFSFFTAFILSIVGTGLGLYYGAKLGRDHF